MTEKTFQEAQVVWHGECRTADDFRIYESQPLVVLDAPSGTFWAYLQVFKFAIVLGTAEMRGPFDTPDEARAIAEQMQRGFAPDPLAEERVAAEAATGTAEVSA